MPSDLRYLVYIWPSSHKAKIVAAFRGDQDAVEWCVEQRKTFPHTTFTVVDNEDNNTISVYA